MRATTRKKIRSYVVILFLIGVGFLIWGMLFSNFIREQHYDRNSVMIRYMLYSMGVVMMAVSLIVNKVAYLFEFELASLKQDNKDLEEKLKK